MDWKEAVVRPHFKGKGDRTDPESYRPISVLPPIAKVFESMMASRIMSHFERSDLFSEAQFGFRKGLSCEHALNLIVDDWHVNLD